MADELDISSERETIARESAIRAAARPLDPGLPGVCEDCDTNSPRLVFGLCAPCRDVRAKLARLRGEA